MSDTSDATFKVSMSRETCVQIEYYVALWKKGFMFEPIFFVQIEVNHTARNFLLSVMSAACVLSAAVCRVKIVMSMVE